MKKKDPLLVLGGFVVLTALIVVLILWSAGLSIFSAHVQATIAKKTLGSKVTVQVFNANNKIQSQGYFEALNADVNGFVAKAKVQKTLVSSDPSQFNKANLAGLEQECIDAAQQYNAAALSISSQAFRSADLPYQLDAGRCTV